MKFKALLQLAGIRKAELARRFGLTKQSVTRWGNNPPYYAEAYLNLLIKYNTLNDKPHSGDKKLEINPKEDTGA